MTLSRPTHREVLWQTEDAFERGDMITLFGRCTVEYDGRAASTLGLGNRLVILKPDGAALVHTDEKRTPVNWQPPGSEHHAAVRDGQFRIRSERTTPAETLDVRFEAVHQFSALSVTGGRDLDLQGSEEDLRQHILDDPELVESGFLPLATERETSAGPIDIYGEDDEGVAVAVELKRRRVGPSAAGQLQRYVAALREEFGDGATVRGILVAPSVTDRAAALLDQHGLEFVALDPTTGRPPEKSEE
ncbi:recombinase RecB [Haloprofundus marisrubri]|uniref:Endonuclease NucS n=1 Tax=Haloprofundus marisrubri TaxID=1514971 RepID=A0A0W1RD60_9EURY|nr:recombinase RecB [Haloprofundus marisrubri]